MSPSGVPRSRPDAFPATHVSLVHRTGSPDPQIRSRAREMLAAVYWGPVYSYLRLSHGIEREDAEDLAQGFFAEALRRDLFARFDPARARFRTYLRTCLDSYVANERKAERRQKRGGAARAVSIEVAELEGRLASEHDADAAFHREWVRGVFGLALSRLRERLEASGKHTHVILFERYDLADERPTYAELASQLGIATTQVTNWLAVARREFRASVLETLRDLCAGDDEFRDEASALLGNAP